MPPNDRRDCAAQILGCGLALGPARLKQRLQVHPCSVRQHRSSSHQEEQNARNQNQFKLEQTLELLVAADIIGTVAVTPSIENLTILGLIVLIRTFLSVSLGVEIEGHWPWRRSEVERLHDQQHRTTEQF
jgi:uncharacterized membrane protein